MKQIPIETQCAEVSACLKAIAHPQRLMILCYLAEGELSVSELQERCHISQSQLSQFLARLTKEGMLSHRKLGQFVFYRLTDQKIKKLMKSLNKIFCSQP